jgi:hypothetical protein
MQKEADLSDDLLNSAEEIAAFLGWTPRQVYHHADKGTIPIIRLPGSRTLRSRKSLLQQTFSAAA